MIVGSGALATDAGEPQPSRLPSLLELTDAYRTQAIIAFVTRVAGPVTPGGWESWDLTVCAAAFEPLATDPFSFSGDFMQTGLDALLATHLDPAGFAYESFWVPSRNGNGFHASIHVRG